MVFGRSARIRQFVSKLVTFRGPTDLSVGEEGIEPSASRTRTERSTDDLHSGECPRRELNPHLTLRTGLLYPLSYEGAE